MDDVGADLTDNYGVVPNERYVPFCKMPPNSVTIVGEVKFDSVPALNTAAKIAVITATAAAQKGEKSVALLLPVKDEVVAVLKDKQYEMSLTEHMSVIQHLHTSTGYATVLDTLLLEMGVPPDELAEWLISCGYLYANKKYYRAYWRHPDDTTVNCTEWANEIVNTMKDNEGLYLVYASRQSKD